MFDISVVKTKAGVIGQVNYGDTILWESEPFNDPEDMPVSQDRLGRDNYTLTAGYLATKTAREKLATVLAGLFQ